ncbi:ABC transporter permease [Moorella naiadis]|uniref:ABC transporter permease n=1 Tax=Moorella naiadis (nom. illeg.) TaxID=3093670 RepID=UPI003D9C95E3
MGKIIITTWRRTNWLIPFIITLIVWIILANSKLWPDYLLPSPQSVVIALGELIKTGTLTQNIILSLERLIIAFIISSAIAIPLGIGIGVNVTIAQYFEPVVNFFQSIAGIAWIPIAILWLGVGWGTVIFVIANAIFFAVLFNTIAGVESIPANMKNVVLTLGGNPWHVLKEVVLPGSLPNVVMGMRQGLAMGWRSLMAAEMIASTSGLGYLIWDARSYYRSDMILVGIFFTGLIWLAMDRLLLRPLEMHTIERWGLVRMGEDNI